MIRISMASPTCSSSCRDSIRCWPMRDSVRATTVDVNGQRYPAIAFVRRQASGLGGVTTGVLASASAQLSFARTVSTRRGGSIVDASRRWT